MDFQYGKGVNQGRAGVQAGYNNYNASGLKGSSEEKFIDGTRDLQKLSAGKSFEGEVTDIIGNKVTLRLNNGQTLQATMQEKMNFNIGDKVIFQVKSNTGGLIEIKPILAAMMEQNPAILRALNAANIPMNDKTIAMMQKLLEEQMPIDKKSLQDIYKQILSNGNASVDTIVQMNKLQFPITEATVGQWEAYRNYEHRIAMEIDHLSDQIPELLSESSMDDNVQGNKLNSQILQLLTQGEEPGLESTIILQEEQASVSVKEPLFGGNKEQVLELLEENISEIEEKQTAALRGEQVAGESVEQGRSLKVDIEDESTEQIRVPNVDIEGMKAETMQNPSETNVSSSLTIQERTSLVAQLRDLPLPEEIKEKILTGGISVGQLLKEIQVQLQNTLGDANLQSLYRGSEFQKLLRVQISKQWLLRPEDILQQEKTKEFYEKLYFQTEQLEKVMEQAGRADSVAAKTVGGLKDNIDFMNQMNQMFTYIQLPLMLSKQPAHSDLYVFTNKKRLQDKEGSVSALLHLDMEALGSMDIYIELEGADLQVKFHLETEDTKILFQDNLDFLTERIEQKGYHMTTEFAKLEKQIDFVEDFLERERGTASMQRFSFDVRA